VQLELRLRTQLIDATRTRIKEYFSGTLKSQGLSSFDVPEFDPLHVSIIG